MPNMEHSAHFHSNPYGRIDLNALMLFYETVNARSINRASILLATPKSTISRRLRLLEQQLNSTLLKRGARALSLTETGRALYERCERIVEELDRANIQTAVFQQEMSGVLRVSMPSFFVSWMAEAIAEFAKAHPSLRLEIDALNRYVDVAEEPFDVAIHFGKPVESFHPSRVLAELPRSFYASPQYLAEHGTPVCHCELSHHELIVHQFQMRDKIFPWFSRPEEQSGQQPPRVIVNNAVLVRDLVLSHLGLGLMPDIMCVEDIAAGRLVRIPLDWESPPLMASATYHARRYSPAKTRAFLDHIARFLKQRTSRRAG